MPTFSVNSLIELNKAHPKLQSVLIEAIKVTDFKILNATRGRAAQTKAYLTGHSKAQFGQSAHNYIPSIAVDLFPAPYDWNDNKAFDALYGIMMPIAKRLGVPLRSGDDWDMNGLRPGDRDNWDAGHYELNPWRTWATRDAHLVED